MGFEIGSQTVVSHAGLSRILWDNTCSLAVFIKNVFLLLQRMPIYDKKIWINFFEAVLTLEIFKNFLQWSSILKNWNSPGPRVGKRKSISNVTISCLLYFPRCLNDRTKTSLKYLCKSLVKCKELDKRSPLSAPSVGAELSLGFWAHLALLFWTIFGDFTVKPYQP